MKLEEPGSARAERHDADGPSPDGRLPMDSALASLVSRERRAHSTSAEQRARVWSRVERSLGLPPGPSGGGAAAPSSSSPRVVPGSAKLAGRLALTAVVIAAAGLLWQASSGPRRSAVAGILASPDGVAKPPSVPRMEPAPATAVPVVSIDDLPAAPPSLSPRVFPTTAIAIATPDAKEAECAICDERVLLDACRRGLRDQAYDAALAAVAEHEARFPNGQLAEERESVHVHALAALGRAGEAEAAKARFEQAFPNSPLLESVKRVGVQ